MSNLNEKLKRMGVVGAGGAGFPTYVKANSKVGLVIANMVGTAEKTGKHWGTPALSPEHGKMLIDMGATFICYMADLLLVKNGLSQIQEQFKPLGFRFNGQYDGPADGRKGS